MWIFKFSNIYVLGHSLGPYVPEALDMVWTFTV